MTTVVMMAAKKTKPPKAPRAMMAPRFSLAPNGSLLSPPSTESGTFTLGTSPCWILLELPDISLSCGCPATIIRVGTCVVGVVRLVVEGVVNRTISVLSARIVVGEGLGGRVLVLLGPRDGVFGNMIGGGNGGDVEISSPTVKKNVF